MKALVLAGGYPQITLLNKLRSRGIYTVLADYYEHPIAETFADKFCRISTLDVEKIRQLAVDEKVDFLITVCTDQALLTVAKVSEELGLPTYIDYQTALNVTNKSYMKSVFMEHGIPTAKYVIVDHFDADDFASWQYPLIVKPVDCNSSKGVKKVTDIKELENALNDAIAFSRTDTAIVEEFFEGEEYSIDVYVSNGKAVILDTTKSEKIKDDSKFVIFRTWHSTGENESVSRQIQDIAQNIADAFGLTDSPMLIQMICKDDRLYVLEFSARTGGGVKFASILAKSSFDVIDAVIDLTLGKKPAVSLKDNARKYMIDDYIYCKPGTFEELDGFDALKEDGTLLDYYLFHSKGEVFESINSSGDRIAGYSVSADTLEELDALQKTVNSKVRVLSAEGQDIMRHDLLSSVIDVYRQ